MKYFNLIKESLSIMKIDNDSNVYAMLDEATAYHGSPFDFDNFNVKFIGTGQGAIAHGWGLYFALNPSTSSGYQSSYTHRLGSNKVYSYKNKSYPQGSVMFTVLKFAKEHSKDKALSFLETLLQDEEWINNNAEKTDYINKLIKTIKSIKDNDIREKIKLQQGQFYTVKIPDLSSFLDEEKKIVDQPAKIRKIMKKIFAELNIKDDVLSMDGKRAYQKITQKYGSDNEWDNRKKASLKLYENGIAGIKYNGYSDGDCAVVFNGDDVKITKKAINVEKDQIQVPRLQMIQLIQDDPNMITKIENPTDDEIIAALEQNADILKYFPKPSDKVFDWVLENIGKLSSKNFRYPIAIIINYCSELSNEQIKKLWDKTHDEEIILKYWDKMDEKIVQDVINKDYEVAINFFNNTAVRKHKEIGKAFKYIKPLLLKDKDEPFIKRTLHDSSKDLEILELYFDGKTIRNMIANFPHIDNLLYNIKGNNTDYINETKNPTVRAFLLYGNNVALDVMKTFTKKDMDIMIVSQMSLSHLNDKVIIPEELVKYYAQRYIDSDSVFKTKMITRFSLDDKMKIIDKQPNMLSYLLDSLPDDEMVQLLNNEKIINLIFEQYSFSHSDRICDLFSKLDDKIQIVAMKNLIKTGHIGGIISIFKDMKTIPLELQKSIVKYGPQYIKYIPNLDIRIQKILVSKNPYNIKYINNPDKNLVKELLSKNPGLEDYIR